MASEDCRLVVSSFCFAKISGYLIDHFGESGIFMFGIETVLSGTHTQPTQAP